MQYLGSTPRIRWSVVTLAAALAAPLASAAAQDEGREDVPEPPAARAWSMESAMDRAASTAPSVRAAAARLAIAESHREHAAMPVLRNPIVGVRALFGVPDDAAATYSFFLGIPFDLSSRQAHRTEETDILLDEADGQLELERIRRPQ